MADKLKAPERPQYRSLATAAKNVRIIPYFIAGDPEIISAYMDQKPPKLKELVEMQGENEVLCVALRRINSRDYLDYENRYGRSINAAVNAVLFVFYVGAKLLKPDMDENPMPKVDFNDDTKIFDTPYGKMYGSLEKNVFELMAFLLSRTGRIIGIDKGGQYDYDPTDEDQIFDHLDPRSFSTFYEDGKSAFFDILEIAGVYDPEETEKRVRAGEPVTTPADKVDKEAFPDLPVNEVGNSPSPSDEDLHKDSEF